MARLGRSRPIPVTIRGRLTYSRTSFALGAFEIPTEWPPVSIVTPNADIQLGPFEIPTEWPPITIERDHYLTLGAFEIPTEWPALQVRIPPRPGDNMTGNDGEIEWNGFVLGGGQNLYRVTDLQGWEDLSEVVSGNVPRPTRDGSYSGGKSSQERIVLATVQMDDNTDSFATSLKAFRDATPRGDANGGELPLVIRLRDETLLANGAITGRKGPVHLVGLGIVQWEVRWTCADPRRYSLGLEGVTVPVNAATDLNNDGNSETHPLIYIKGPVQDPVLVNQTLQRSMTFNLELALGERLEIDTDNATITLAGENAMGALVGGVPPGDFVLDAGINTILYTAGGDGTNGVDFLWSHAHQ